MNKSGIFLISLLAFSGFIVLASTAPVKAQDNVIVIETVATAGQNKYNKDSIDLQPDTTYTIVFKNVQETGHNLIIDKNDNLEDDESTLAESADLHIGLDSALTAAPGGTWKGEWNATWTTPAEDTEILYYCGFPGHYAGGMYGVFVIGEGDAPGFGFFFAFAALAMTAVAIPRLRKD